MTLTAAAAATGLGVPGLERRHHQRGNPLAVTMTHNTNLIATFTDILSPTVSVDSPNGGETLLVGYMPDDHVDGAGQRDGHGGRASTCRVTAGRRIRS